MVRLPMLVFVYPPILYNDANDPPEYPALASNPSSSEFETSATSSYGGKSVSQVDNGDGTSTRITTGYSGSSSSGGGSIFGSSSTTTEIIDNATGNVLSSTTEESATDDNPLSNPSNYEVSDPEGDAEGVGDRFADRINSFIVNLRAAPIYSAFNSVFTVPAGGTSVHMLDMGSYGTVEFDFSDYSNVFHIFGWAMVFASVWVAGKLIVANKG